MNGVWVDAALGVVRRKGWFPLLAAQQRDAPQEVLLGDAPEEVLLGDAPAGSRSRRWLFMK